MNLQWGLDFKNEKLQSFTDILKNVWWKLDKKLTLEDLRYSAIQHLLNVLKMELQQFLIIIQAL